MTDLRKAAEMALEVIELAMRSHSMLLLSDPPQEAWKTYGVEQKARETVLALRAALEQQTRTVAHGHEWKVLVCGVDCHPGGPLCNGYCTGKTDDPPAAKEAQR